MKKIISILTLILSLAIVSDGFAQDNKRGRDDHGKEKWEKFRQEKHDIFVQTMELTDEQAKAFLPLYEEMEKKKFELTRQVRRESRQLLKNENATDEQYKAVADRAAALRMQEAEIESQYYAEFCKILSPRQQFLYHRCEIEFQKKMMKKKQNEGGKEKHHK